MRKVSRIIWWKCVLWIALGAAIGAGVATFLSQPGPPIGAKRLDAARFVMICTSPRVLEGQSIDHISIYPGRLGVQMLTFTLQKADVSPATMYAYANEPFVSANDLELIRNRARRTMLTVAGSAVLAGAAELSMNAAADQPDRRWANVQAFLDHAKTSHPELAYQSLQWRTPAELERNGAIIGAFALGLIGSLLFARRSEADRLAAELLLNTTTAASGSPPPTGPSAEDQQRLADLDAMLTASLKTGATDGATAALAPGVAGEATSTAPIVELQTEAIIAPVDQPEEEKDYKGEFYPAARGPKKREGFSLVELIVTIGVIGILIAILLPTLLRARQSADAVACAANLHSIGAGMQMYLQANQNTFPASYLYIGHKIENGVQTPTVPAAGYIHWSSLLFGEVAPSAFTCPAMERGGMPPTNTTPDNRNPGQNCPSDPDPIAQQQAPSPVVDQQAPRLAYTANEALLPRNKFVAPMQAAVRVYRWVKANEVAHSSSVILVTEMIDNQTAISYDDVAAGWIMSHRPISGFVGLNGEVRLYFLPPTIGYRQATRADLDADPMTSTSSNTLLNLVGRNHGPRQGYPDQRRSNFLYVDGHVEFKSVYDTVEPFEWGDKFYSLVPNEDLQK